jgi:uncharacterized protein
MTFQSGPDVPVPTDVSRPHWEGGKRGELMVQRCGICQRFVFLPALLCPYCLSEDLIWTRSSGRGIVHTFTCVFRPVRPDFEVPYVVAVVTLEEGWHMMTNLIGCRWDEIVIGMAVEVTFVDINDVIALPFFRPSRTARAEQSSLG